MSLLRLENLSAGYGATVVLEQISMELAAGEALSVIGRNGVGKSTLLATIMGHTELHGGDVIFAGGSLAKQKTYRRVWRGIGYVPQEREVFPSLSVDENLAVAERAKTNGRERVYTLFPQLAARRRHRGDQLSGGEQQMLSIGRALLTDPKLLLLDEPSEGLAPVIVDQLIEALQTLRGGDGGMALVLVEQNSRVALDFAPRCVVMNRGRVARDGDSAGLRDDPALLARLIGVDAGG